MFIKYIITTFNNYNLINHLMMNGYDFGYDSDAETLFVLEDQADDVETIMFEHNIGYIKEV